MRGWQQSDIDAYKGKLQPGIISPPSGARPNGITCNAGRGNKYHARSKVDCKGIKHRSSFECDQINALYLLEKAGLIYGLEIEPKGIFVDQLAYKPDALFVEIESNRVFLYEVKGRVLSRWRCVLTEFREHGARRGKQRIEWLRIARKVKGGITVEDVRCNAVTAATPSRKPGRMLASA